MEKGYLENLVVTMQVCYVAMVSVSTVSCIKGNHIPLVGCFSS